MTPKNQEKLFKVEYARELLKIAQGDLDSAIGLASIKRGRPETVCFLAQQAVEKALKAVLCHKKIPVPLVHDLGILIAKFPATLQPPCGYEVAALNEYATIRRYEEGHVELTSEEVGKVLDLSRDLLDWASKQVAS